MRLSIQTKIFQLMLGLAIVMAGSSQVASAAGLGLFSNSCCDSACDSGCCDADSCGDCCDDPLCCDASGCDGVSCTGCSSCSLCSSMPGMMKNLVKRSDHCFDDFISPMINFVHFEDPRNLTEIRPIFVNHWVPNTIGNNVPAGGTIQLFAVQFRIALTERLSLIGVKDGYIWESTGGALDTLLDEGWASITAGLKYNLVRDTQSGTLLSAGATYEIPVGSNKAFQNVADGEFHLFVTGGQRLWCGKGHLMSAFGWRVPSDGFLQSESIHWSNHFDVKLTERSYLFTELAWWHWVDAADGGLALGVAGQDLFNLPTSDVEGNNLVTQNVGTKFKPNGNAEYGIAYEFPLTGFKDVIEGRLQLEMILRY